MKIFGGEEVNVYDLSVTNSIPTWLTETAAGRRKLGKDEAYRRRIEVIHEFNCPVSSQRIKTSNDGNFIFVTGDYPPVVKCYDTAELSLKFERRIDSEILEFEILSDDYTKLVFLGADRTLYFHAAYGNHYKTRIPKFGRSFCMNQQSSDLFIAAAGAEVYRLNLERGQFLAGLKTNSSLGNNVLAHNSSTHLLAVGGDSGIVSCFDVRCKPVGVSSLKLSDSITSLCFDCNDYLTLAVGNSKGVVQLFDIRSAKPVVEKEHINELPIKSIEFSVPSRHVVSSDKKSIKVWDKTDGSHFAAIEAENDFGDICLVKRRDKRRMDTSGLILATGEQSEIRSFYIPQLGPAPHWCSFLDNVTEELEEAKVKDSVYENYKFVTREELETLGLAHLASSNSNMVRSYMHGFFMDLKLFNNVKVLLDKELLVKEKKELKKRRIQKKLEAEAGERIKPKRKRVKVNQENKTEDNRFGDMFEDEDFEIDEESEHFQKVFTSGVRKVKTPEREEREEESEEESELSGLSESESESEASVKISDVDSDGDDSEAEEGEEALWKKESGEKADESTVVKELSGGNIEMTFEPKRKTRKRK